MGKGKGSFEFWATRCVNTVDMPVDLSDSFAVLRPDECYSRSVVSTFVKNWLVKVCQASGYN